MEIFFELLPQAAPFKPRSRVFDLKSRLDWGEPALTIVDARPRAAFNECHIMGAIPLAADELVARAQVNLEVDRDIYVYGETDEETEAAAASLRGAGYKRVSEIVGGLAAWKAVNYEVEKTAVAV
ncbi:rhodanese-related sulfurtransferase [Rubidibacter lacunae KORDI 51-2]|uniref:Rhodanese-related sulfurtransferase n=1 Tax=Rubidibacter lacunae KORDI 51-2 TaxID=582515 RepID=U5DKR7_9CHRO|nr:rhodanese-like domain-containing protein [Rubidibacter lacunae]ERN41149.1 rhodanese-related sulfurtransferase [Rubidibacter lacunae KORDI 51-2]